MLKKKLAQLWNKRRTNLIDKEIQIDKNCLKRWTKELNRS